MGRQQVGPVKSDGGGLCVCKGRWKNIKDVRKEEEWCGLDHLHIGLVF